MKVSAVIAEFNPMHDGHIHLINEAKKNDATHVIAIMSGNFVQRGDCAIYSKWDRAEDAVKNGIDLVIELPTSKSISTASVFASAGVEIAEKIGCVNELFFGSECGDISKIKEVCSILSDINYKKQFENLYSLGLSYPSARQKAFAGFSYDNLVNILSNPNDILGIEYVSALQSMHSKITPVCFSRKGEKHDSLKNSGNFVSSSFLRKKIFEGAIVPSHNVYSLKNVERTIVYAMRNISCEEMRKIADVDEGLENRIKKSVSFCNTVDEILMDIKTKRYTYSRLRRIILNIFLSVKREDVYEPVRYLKVLCFNEKGREILRLMRSNAKLPIIMKSSDIYKTKNINIISQYEREIKYSDIFALCSSSILPCSTEQKMSAFLV